MKLHKLFKKRNSISILILSICLILIPFRPSALLGLFINMRSLTEIENCPLCYGRSMCHCFDNDNFRLNWKHFWTNLLNVYSNKCVFFGHCNGEMIVVKKFSDDQTSINNVNVCPNSASVSLIEIKDTIKNLSEPQYGNVFQKFKLCPSTEKLDIFLKPSEGNSSGGKLTEIYLNLCYMIQMRVEPIIQQVIKDWAVAEYLGSCGRLAISKDHGDTLTWVVPSLSWTERTLIAVQLLQFAFNATFQHPDFAFYFTDMSPDNIVVSSQRNARLVDLDHVIVVDKYPKDLPDGWEIWHQSYHDESISGFAFSAEDVCTHKTSDLNVYAICQEILSEQSDLLDGGLLYSPPQHMLHIRRLIQECISPSTTQSRFDIAQSIIHTLNIDKN